MIEYIKEHEISGLRFYVADQTGVEMYDPLKDYTLLEYQWVRDNLDLRDQVVCDIGSHHGNYAVVFRGCKHIICIDKEPDFNRICRVNLGLNGMHHHASIIEAKLDAKTGMGDVTNAEPDIIKIDIEGGEFAVFPNILIDNPQVHTWIVEVHPYDGQDPDWLAQLFEKRGFELLKVYRDPVEIAPYRFGEKWTIHATMIARK